MALEIERKFLLTSFDTSLAQRSSRIVQGYICSDEGKTVRIRIKKEKGFITIKGKSDKEGLARYEWEKEIPLEDAEDLMKLCSGGVIDKVRHEVEVGKHTFEVDVFAGNNQGLIVAEVELSDKNETFATPDWLGEEVTGDPKYYNSMLMKHPYSEWK
ncbi:CYTH domain-containing protein [Flammeovirga yaeyamensis]|uniref:CYTH domain-containing protein n=1 Tax=Flammeovirga yaeyamensis TaxID=367791 RepID=A0AAX1N2K6_9BACT|nr:CYTH domain-containing protein [Flammeovirga yaeyamensis]MBB3700820.1 CYTH domain-containing protein [Flammeovirga yaeyamensis]NMF37825.1 CYTH domain-containing protein [Flammeovirga yaeyamensis]QWG01813.1 CYTH domain-containing protein [Flammeovirga yaeyamensis]